MPNQPKTPNRVIRVEDRLWSDYEAACGADGTTRSDDLRAYMARKVRAYKRHQVQAGDGTERDQNGTVRRGTGGNDAGPAGTKNGH